MFEIQTHFFSGQLSAKNQIETLKKGIHTAQMSQNQRQGW